MKFLGRTATVGPRSNGPRRLHDARKCQSFRFNVLMILAILTCDKNTS
jgi:hypothetical protein